VRLPAILQNEAAAIRIREDLEEKENQLLLALTIRTYHDPMQEMLITTEKRAKWALLQELRQEWFGDDKLEGEGQMFGDE
jgi:hypothetical protein